MVCCWAGEAGTSGNTAHRLIPDGCVGRPGVEDYFRQEEEEL